jgi:hypothetical protein
MAPAQTNQKSSGINVGDVYMISMYHGRRIGRAAIIGNITVYLS